jgi:myo-inositol 2-dehydrogenase / D-chiro-inositol 1-dehydrogenase
MINFSLFGAGRIGTLHAANIAASHPRARLAYVYDLDPTAAAVIARKYGATVAPSVDAALGDAAVDAVLIASPTNTHVQLITASARAGKAVLCEKPIDLDIELVERCRKDIAGTGVAIQIGFNRRFDRSHRAVRDSDVGAIELLIITSRDPGPPPHSYIKVSGGIFRDMTIHDFDLARFILRDDPIEEVFATGSALADPALAKLGDVDTAMVVMRAASGALVHINNSRRAVYGYDQRVELFGAKGMVQSENLRPSSVRRYDCHVTDAKDPLLNFFIERYQQSYLDELHEFIDAVAGKRRPVVGFDDGRCALLLANAALESMRSGQSVRVNLASRAG